MINPMRIAPVTLAAAALVGALGLAERALGQSVGSKGLKVAPPAQPSQPIKVQPVVLNSLKSQQIMQLPDSQLVTIAGKTVTLGELRARQKAVFGDSAAKLKAAHGQLVATQQALKTQFEQAQRSRLEAEKAKLQAEVARLKGSRPGN